MQQTKRCSKCGLTLPLTTEYFSKNQSTNTGGDKYFRPECKSCTTKARRGCAQAKKHAGYPRKPVPGTPCDCCGRDDMLLIFDHDHVSLAHRGWICQNCNQGLGRLGDTVASVTRALDYLKRPPLTPGCFEIGH